MYKQTFLLLIFYLKYLFINLLLFQTFNEVLVSYGAQNLRKFYSSINTDFKNYLNRLHSRIPHRIVPLIWNDPVIQKIAMITL